MSNKSEDKENQKDNYGKIKQRFHIAIIPVLIIGLLSILFGVNFGLVLVFALIAMVSSLITPAYSFLVDDPDTPEGALSLFALSTSIYGIVSVGVAEGVESGISQLDVGTATGILILLSGIFIHIHREDLAFEEPDLIWFVYGLILLSQNAVVGFLSPEKFLYLSFGFLLFIYGITFTYLENLNDN